MAEISLSPCSTTFRPQIRSAESTPVMLRRYLRVSGIFSSCAQSMHPEAEEEEDEDEDEDEPTSRGKAVSGFSLAVREQKLRWRRRKFLSSAAYSNSPSSVPGSPSPLTHDHSNSRLPRRIRIWRSVKKFNFRQIVNAESSDTLQVEKRPSLENGSEKVSVIEATINGGGNDHSFNSRSQPNLLASPLGDVTSDKRRTKDDTACAKEYLRWNRDTDAPSIASLSSLKVGGFFTRKKKKKHEIALNASGPNSYQTTDCPSTSVLCNTGNSSILVRNSGSNFRRNSTNRVEFAATDQVIPVIISDSSPVSQPVSSTIPSRHHYSNDRLFVEPYNATSMTSPVKTLFSRGHRRVERQSTHDSTSSTTVEDLLRQETYSGGSIADPDSPPSITSYLLHVHLKDGRDLVIRDASGSSDPYVKFKFRNKLIYKSNTIFKNLNPHWDEQFYELIDDPSVLLHVDVFDYDRFASDDFMGSALLDLSQLEAKKPTELKVPLSEENSDQYMGYLLMQISLSPMTREEQEQFLRKKARGSLEGSSASGSFKRGQKGAQVWNSVVNIVLVEGKNLLPTDIHTSMPLPDPYVKFKLGVEKYKSKPASKTLEPKWLEQFDLHIFDEQSHQLELMVFDKRKDIFMGRCKIDLSTIEREVTQQKWYELEDGAGQILLLLTISGTIGMETVADLNDSALANIGIVSAKYALARTFDNLRDIGHLVVKVYRAQGLASADIGGKSDPFCVVELVNARLQTHTEYKTLNPEWNKIFTFNVKDIHSVLEVTVYDEDPNKKAEFLGKICIPLLKIRNGEKRWFALKDRKLQRRAKGQILLEMEVTWNPVRASIRTFNPKEEKYMANENRFKRKEFIRNVMRVKAFVMAAMDVGAFIQSCFSWESTPRSIMAFLVYMIVVSVFEIYMLPMILLLLFIKSYFYKVIVGGMKLNKEETQEYFESEDDDDEMDEKSESTSQKPEEKKSFTGRVRAIQDTLAMVQNALDYIASSLERVKNTFNFTQPFLSWLAISVLFAVAVVLYLVPIRWLAMAWGINKFTKKLRSPNAVPNNELLDYLSRVPSDDEIRMYGEFRPDPVDGATGGSVGQAGRAKKHRNS